MITREIEDVLELASDVARAKAIWREIRALQLAMVAILRAAATTSVKTHAQSQLDRLGMRGTVLRCELLALYGLTSTLSGEVQQ